MPLPARVLNEIFVDKVNHEGTDSVLPLLNTFITKHLEETFGEENVEINLIDFDKTERLWMLTVDATVNGVTSSRTTGWTELELLTTTTKSITDLILDFLDRVFVVSPEDTSVS